MSKGAPRSGRVSIKGRLILSGSGLSRMVKMHLTRKGGRRCAWHCRRMCGGGGGGMCYHILGCGARTTRKPSGALLILAAVVVVSIALCSLLTFQLYPLNAPPSPFFDTLHHPRDWREEGRIASASLPPSINPRTSFSPSPLSSSLSGELHSSPTPFSAHSAVLDRDRGADNLLQTFFISTPDYFNSPIYVEIVSNLNKHFLCRRVVEDGRFQAKEYVNAVPLITFVPNSDKCPQLRGKVELIKVATSNFKQLELELESVWQSQNVSNVDRTDIESSNDGYFRSNNFSRSNKHDQKLNRVREVQQVSNVDQQDIGLFNYYKFSRSENHDQNAVLHNSVSHQFSKRSSAIDSQHLVSNINQKDTESNKYYPRNEYFSRSKKHHQNTTNIDQQNLSVSNQFDQNQQIVQYEQVHIINLGTKVTSFDTTNVGYTFKEVNPQEGNNYPNQIQFQLLNAEETSLKPEISKVKVHSKSENKFNLHIGITKPVFNFSTLSKGLSTFSYKNSSNVDSSLPNSRDLYIPLQSNSRRHLEKISNPVQFVHNKKKIDTSRHGKFKLKNLYDNTLKSFAKSNENILVPKDLSQLIQDLDHLELKIAQINMPSKQIFDSHNPGEIYNSNFHYRSLELENDVQRDLSRNEFYKKNENHVILGKFLNYEDTDSVRSEYTNGGSTLSTDIQNEINEIGLQPNLDIDQSNFLPTEDYLDDSENDKLSMMRFDTSKNTVSSSPKPTITSKHVPDQSKINQLTVKRLNGGDSNHNFNIFPQNIHPGDGLKFNNHIESSVYESVPARPQPKKMNTNTLYSKLLVENPHDDEPLELSAYKLFPIQDDSMDKNSRPLSKNESIPSGKQKSHPLNQQNQEKSARGPVWEQITPQKLPLLNTKGLGEPAKNPLRKSASSNDLNGLDLLEEKPKPVFACAKFNSSQKVAIVIPYRNRSQHLNILLRNLHPILQRQRIDYTIFVVEQSAAGQFNRGMLMNIGFAEALNMSPSYDCFIFHDVDLLPEDDRNLYICSMNGPRHMSVAVDVFHYQLPYSDIFGGVSALSARHFQLVNGFSNEFWGWGGEDDDMAMRIKMKGLHLTRYPASIARYTMLDHDKGPVSANRFRKLYYGRKRFKTEGLSSLKYRRLALKRAKLFTWLLVELDHLQSDHSAGGAGYNFWEMLKNFNPFNHLFRS